MMRYTNPRLYFFTLQFTLVLLLAAVPWLGTSEFCAKKLQILRVIFANSAQILRNISTRFFFYGKIVYYPEYHGLLKLLVHLS